MNGTILPPTDGLWEKHYGTWRSTLNGVLHNSLGPAVLGDHGEKEWYVDGKYVLEQDFPLTVISFLLGVDKQTAELIEQEMKL